MLVMPSVAYPFMRTVCAGFLGVAVKPVHGFAAACSYYEFQV